MNLLSQLDLFKCLNEREVMRYSSRCFWREYGENELVIDFEDDSKDVRFLVTGRARVILRIATGKEIILGDMGPGDFVGEIAAIDNQGRAANVTVMNTSRMCVMPQSVFLDILAESPEVSLNIMRVLTSRIRKLNMRLTEHCFLQAKHRICVEIMRKSRPRLGHEDQRVISPPPLQREIAERVGTRREVVSRQISALKKLGIVEKTPRALVITDIPAINKIIDEGWEDD